MKWRGIVLALVAACGSGTLKNGVCFVGGEPDCGGPCPSFDDSAAEVRAETCQPYYYKAEIGTCGSYRYTTESTGFTGHTIWFDASGKVVAFEGGGDIALFCDDQSGVLHTGPDLQCVETPTEIICPGI